MKSESGIDYQLLYTHCCILSDKQRGDNTIKSIFLPLLKAKKYKSLLNEPTVEFYITHYQLTEGKDLFQIRLSILPTTVGWSENIYITAICTRDLKTNKIVDAEEYFHSSLSTDYEGSFDVKIDFA